MDGMMQNPNPSPATIHRGDYQPPDFLITAVELRFTLGAAETLVESRLRIERNPQGKATAALTLHGRKLELVRLVLDGRELTPAEYRMTSEDLTLLPTIRDSATVEITTRIHPEQNLELEGLYASGGNLCTQCEAEGFRKITYYLDRPDVLAKFTVTLVGSKDAYPVLLSNGNCLQRRDLDGGLHEAVWHDPFAKPSYLFALVAGRLGVLRDQFVTRSGRRVALEIYAADSDLPRCNHAMDSLKRSMRWDEEVFGLEYDLDVFMIVATDDFNMGAMENKGLNIFNTRYVLADPETATDQDYRDVETVIAHEYFHNWTGNRVTCRDWFQLSLKEGLTVFRDQEFSSDEGSRAIKRISDVKSLRQIQFPEDSGPTAHSVRPESYVEINNFYTATVYSKGAEVIRMMHRLLGAAGFRKGMDLYFKRHDGQAVTCDDFVAAMEDASGVDLRQFRRWYSQAGTPRLKINSHYHPEQQVFHLIVEQHTPPTPEQTEKFPLHIPLALGLIGSNGALLHHELLAVTEPRQEFHFSGITSRPVPSLLRGFSAPVLLESNLSLADDLFLLAHDTDEFAAWDAGQTVYKQILAKAVADDASWRTAAETLVEALARKISAFNQHPQSDPEALAQILLVPPESDLLESLGRELANPTAVHQARQAPAADDRQRTSRTADLSVRFPVGKRGDGL